jgi:uncharacterized membrane protein
VCAAGITVIGYGIGSTRAFDYDGAVTVANFIRTSSFADVFTRQSTYNNHLGFSVIEHGVWRITGSDAEWLLRAVPILAAAGCVGLLVAWTARRFATLTALLTGLLLAVNPVFVSTAREVRGYSLLTLCALGSTMLLAHLERNPSRAVAVGYVATTAFGLAVHLYMIPVIVLQIVWLSTRNEIDRAWRIRWGAVTLIGGACYLGMLPALRDANRTKHGVDWSAPIHVAYDLLGSQPIAVALSTIGLTLLLLRRPRSRATVPLATTAAVILAVVWLIAPTELYPRFFVWATPAIALGTALGLQRLPLGPILATVTATAALTVSLPGGATPVA